MKLRMYGETATQCNTLCNTLQHAATRFNTPQHATTRCNTQNIRRLAEYEESEEIKSVWTSDLYSHKRAVCIRKRALYIRTRAVLFRKELYIPAKEPYAASKVPYILLGKSPVHAQRALHIRKSALYIRTYIFGKSLTNGVERVSHLVVQVFGSLYISRF